MPEESTGEAIGSDVSGTGLHSQVQTISEGKKEADTAWRTKKPQHVQKHINVFLKGLMALWTCPWSAWPLWQRRVGGVVG